MSQNAATGVWNQRSELRWLETLIRMPPSWLPEACATEQRPGRDYVSQLVWQFLGVRQHEPESVALGRDVYCGLLNMPTISTRYAMRVMMVLVLTLIRHLSVLK